jgi:molybdopterin-guanine dinucleotide biosynthesis protein A
MGQDKALLEIEGKPLIRRMADLLHALTDEVVISAGKPGRYEFLHLPVVTDVFPGQGPMAGIHSAMARTTRPLLLVLACDLPRVHLSLLRQILDATEGFDAAVPATSEGRIHPLCAAYRTTCFDLMEQSLVRKANGLKYLLRNPLLRVRLVTSEDGSFCDSDLANINDYKDLRSILEDRTRP